jgi:hypothetical protein
MGVREGEGGTYRSTTSPFSFSMVVVGGEVVWDGFWGVGCW